MREMNTCPACGSDRTEASSTATGPRLHCRQCFHAWRTVWPEFTRDTYRWPAEVLKIISERTRDFVDDQMGFLSPHIAPKLRVLEVGSGTGELAVAYQKAFKAKSYEAVELHAGSAEVARGRVDAVHELPVSEAMEKGLLLPGTFDLVIMSHVLEHVGDIEAELKSVVDLLSDTGKLFIEVPNGSGNKSLPYDDIADHLHFFSPTSLIQVLARFGFTVDSIETGAYRDRRFSDNMRVMAYRPQASRHPAYPLTEHQLLARYDAIAIWGVGRLTGELVENFFDPARIAFFVDTDPTKQGTEVLGRPVVAPSALATKAHQALVVNSIAAQEDIVRDLFTLIPRYPNPVVPIESLLLPSDLEYDEFTLATFS